MNVKVPAALWDREYVADLLRQYWSSLPDGSPVYTGARFERVGGGGDRREVVHHFASEDFVAVAMLSVDVPERAILHVLEPARPGYFNSLLREIPSDTELADATEEHVAHGGPAWTLWTRLCEVHGIGPVGAGKLLARKRPHLLPVYDSVIKRVFERPKRDLTFWSDVRTQLRTDQGALVSHLEAVRDLAEIGEDISVLRVLDTAAWLHGRTVRG
ncbi:DUF6308 family protein [Streptomyces sp. NPDC056796]|uniref:DUF6308 family protein n=1 Tax=Streptomyces sp. NPDC056796 TaxID=3345947 RepID=UPI0036D1D368